MGVVVVAVLAVIVAARPSSLAEIRTADLPTRQAIWIRKSYHWHGRLLRARRQRPRDGCAAEQRNELAPVHSITSSARSRIEVGIATPIALAVFRA